MSIRYTRITICKCPKCQYIAKQVLFNYRYNIYKCSKCNNIYA